MEKIKYKAWIPKLKHMVDVYEIVFTKAGYSIRFKRFHHLHYRTFKQDEIILLQYIGLDDKDGKEVHEGDVYEPDNRKYQEHKRIYNFNEKIIVVWSKWRAGFIGERYSDGEGTRGCTMRRMAQDWLPDMIMSNGKYIGNIYENPELMEDKC